MIGFIAGSQFAARSLVDGGPSLRDVLAQVAFGPLADYVALAFLGTPLARSTSAGAAIVFVALLGLTPVGLAVATRQASTLWFTDEPRRGETGTARGSSGGFGPPRPFAWTKSGRVAWGVLVRAVRHPQKLSHLVVIVFFVGPLGTTFVQSSPGAIGPLAAATSVGVGTYLAGAAFGLNPLGDDRPQLPLLLLTETSPRTVVRGRIVAGLAVGLPVAAVGPLASIAGGTAPASALAFAAVGVGTCLAAAHFAVGLGAAYPIYEEREFWGTETVVPSTLVTMGYLFVVGIGTAIALVAAWFALGGALRWSLPVALGGGAYLLLTGSGAYGSYRYAVRRYRNYEVD